VGQLAAGVEDFVEGVVVQVVGDFFVLVVEVGPDTGINNLNEDLILGLFVLGLCL
jgi:hypothetical protein